MKENEFSPMITFENVTVRLRDRFVLRETSLRMLFGENWVVLGSNGAGKSTLARAIMGDVPVVGGRIIRHDPSVAPARIGFVSFDLQKNFIRMEESGDHARSFSQKHDDFTRVYQILFPENSSAFPGSKNVQDSESAPCAKNMERVLEFLNPDRLLEKSIRFLSNGEMRRVLIGRALLKAPRLLILDEPFDGLDAQFRTELLNSLEKLAASGLHLMLITHRIEQIPRFISRGLLLENCKVVMNGSANAVVERYLMPAKTPTRWAAMEESVNRKTKKEKEETIISLNRARVVYGKTKVFEDLNWTVKSGENWAITGPNGAGKSTLLSLISADNPQAYANDIMLFGKKRGSGESIWEIKRNLGIVSSEFQIRYRKPVTSLEVVISGFFDSVGLYRQHTREQGEMAENWIEKLGLAHLAPRLFDRLSHGEQRMLLIARALVKSPRVLVLDEPCQGLDLKNRRCVLSLIDRVGGQGLAQLLLVTHFPDEIPTCITHVLNFSPSADGGFRASPMPVSKYISGNCK